LLAIHPAIRRREKMFGLGRPRALDRNAKVRIMHWARCLSRRTEKGRAYGQLTAKAVAVLEALLWSFHNAKSGLCFPSYETIAEMAHCARSTVAEAIRALEDAGVLSWVHRLKRVRVPYPGLFGDETRVVPQRTSNAYHFTDPSPSADRACYSKPCSPQTSLANVSEDLLLSDDCQPDASARATRRSGFGAAIAELRRKLNSDT
jgi:hypothetical protein